MGLNDRKQAMYVCIHCRQGLMDPVAQLDEVGHLDRYQCSYCGHQATIPPVAISVTQALSCLAGAGIALFLLFRHLGQALQAFQLGNGNMVTDLGLSLLATILLVGFVVTIIQAIQSMKTQLQYRHVPPRSG
ncbi:hypothetical protein [Tamilnaduibacter salinus]|nr:hypothetical protein [Tamilnaduibacter salinus]